MTAQDVSWTPTTSSASQNIRGAAPLPISIGSPRPRLVLVDTESLEENLDDYISVSEVVSRYESDPSRRQALVEARKELAQDPALANTLSALRLRLGLSQSDLAAIYGTSQPHIARIEAGDDVRVSTVRKLSAALQVTPEVILNAILQRTQVAE